MKLGPVMVDVSGLELTADDVERLVSGEAYTEWNVLMATAFLAMLPPALVVIGMQKWFVKGLVDTEK